MKIQDFPCEKLILGHCHLFNFRGTNQNVIGYFSLFHQNINLINLTLFLNISKHSLLAYLLISHMISGTINCRWIVCNRCPGITVYIKLNMASIVYVKIILGIFQRNFWKANIHMCTHVTDKDLYSITGKIITFRELYYMAFIRYRSIIYRESCKGRNKFARRA